MSLVATVEAFREPIEYDLIRLGLRLRDVGTDEFTWRDLWVVIRNLPRDSALARAQDREAAEWGLSEHLLALVVDGVHINAWLAAGGKRSMRPKPLPRPGVESDDKTRYGKGALPVDEMAEWLGWLN